MIWGSADTKKGTLEVSKADAVTLLITTGTNYRLSPKTFSHAGAEKLNPDEFPHDAVSARMQAAHDLGYTELKITLCPREYAIRATARYIFFVREISNYTK